MKIRERTTTIRNGEKNKRGEATTTKRRGLCVRVYLWEGTSQSIFGVYPSEKNEKRPKTHEVAHGNIIQCASQS